jgi:hypothetical protein
MVIQVLTFEVLRSLDYWRICFDEVQSVALICHLKSYSYIRLNEWDFCSEILFSTIIFKSTIWSNRLAMILSFVYWYFNAILRLSSKFHDLEKSDRLLISQKRWLSIWINYILISRITLWFNVWDQIQILHHKYHCYFVISFCVCFVTTGAFYG